MAMIWVARSRNSIAQFMRKMVSNRNERSSYYAASYYYMTVASSGNNITELGKKQNNFSNHKTAAMDMANRRFESAKASEQLIESLPSYSTDEDYENEDGNEEAIEFPGGKVGFTPQMKFISEATDKRIPCYRVLDDDGRPISGGEFAGAQLEEDKAMKMYKSMVTLQLIDSYFYEAQRQGRISFYLTSMGEEAINIATAAALSPDDVVLPQYREPGILLWRGMTIQELADQCFGNKDGHGKGRQMPIHYGSKELNFFTVSSPIATQLPQAAGVAYSLKMENRDACVVAFTGDGGTSEGDFHAGMNFAAVMEVPVMFICRNNGWAISTPIHEQFRSDGVVVKGQAYGIRSIRVDGNDALAVYSAIRAAREMIVREKKPVLVEALTYRVGHHSTSDDSTKYRGIDEIEHWKTARSPLARFRKWVRRNNWWSDEEEARFRESVKKQVLKAIQVADRKEKPSFEDLFNDVYDRKPSNLLEQERALREAVERHKNEYPTDIPL